MLGDGKCNVVTMVNKHNSDSSAQQAAENLILQTLNKELKLELIPGRLSLPDGVFVQIDGLDKCKKVICEIYSRVGKLKGSQPDKVASDLLKLMLVQNSIGGTWRKIICFADEDAAKVLKGKSWLAAAAAEFKVEVYVVAFSETERGKIMSAQALQCMINK